MTGGALLDRVAAAGAAASLDPDGRVRIAGASRLPAELLDVLRQNRAAVAEALAASRAATVGRAADATLVAPDPGDAMERAAMADARRARSGGAGAHSGDCGGFGAHPTTPLAPSPEAAASARISGARAGIKRPPSWSDPQDVPPPGAWCGCCGRFSGIGGRWWREAAEPKGWRCWTCHPPVPLPPGGVVERRTY